MSPKQKILEHFKEAILVAYNRAIGVSNGDVTIGMMCVQEFLKAADSLAEVVLIQHGRSDK